jgi:hypothetical protein
MRPSVFANTVGSHAMTHNSTGANCVTSDVVEVKHIGGKSQMGDVKPNGQCQFQGHTAAYSSNPRTFPASSALRERD